MFKTLKVTSSGSMRSTTHEVMLYITGTSAELVNLIDTLETAAINPDMNAAQSRVLWELRQSINVACGSPVAPDAAPGGDPAARLAALIRRVDGSHTCKATELADRLIEHGVQVP